MEYQAFLNRLQKRGSKKHVITHCLGARDAWKWVRKNKWERLGGHPCPQSLYGSIIDHVHQLLVEQMMEGHIIDMPMQMGSFYVASIPARVEYKEGKIKTNYRVDWLKTLKLWYEDKEALESHQTIKRVQKDIVYIGYDKRKANFTNKRFYVFRANRSLVRKVGHALEEGSLRFKG